MRKFLLFICIAIIFFAPVKKTFAQTNQTVTNGQNTAAVTFPAGGCVYNWVNNNPSVGLIGSGTGNIPSFTAVNNGNLPIVANVTVTPTPGSFLYLSDSYNNKVYVVDAATGATIATIPTDKYPLGVAVSPDKTKVYVSDQNPGGLSSVSAISTSTNTVIKSIPSGTGSWGIVVSPDGKWVYTANENANTVSVIDAVNNILYTTVPVSAGPVGITVSPDGSEVYVAGAYTTTANVDIINTATNTVSATIPIGGSPWSAAVSPDGSRLYISNPGLSSVQVINTSTKAIIATVPTGGFPSGIVVSPDGTRVYVADNHGYNVSVIDATNNSIITTIPTGQNPEGLSISPDGKSLYVINTNGKSVVVFDTQIYNRLATFPFGSSIDLSTIGNFLLSDANCTAAPVSFNITVNPSPPAIIASTATGNIYACVGAPSSNTQQFSVSANNLSGNVTVTAPVGFEVSLSLGSGFASSVAIVPTSGAVSDKIVYVRSASSGTTGNIAGSVTLSAVGVASQNVAVTGVINPLATVGPVANQSIGSGQSSTEVDFTGTGNNYSWTNDQPGIGLGASGDGNIPVFKAINNTNAPVTAKITVTPQNTGYAYIPNNSSNTVSVISMATNAVIATLPVVSNPYGVAMSPDGSKAYVTNGSPDGKISIIDTKTNTVTANIAAGQNPSSICISPDGSKLYVTNYPGQLIVISTATNAIVKTILADNDAGISLSPDGSLLYEVNFSSGTVTIIKTSDYSQVAVITVGLDPYNITLSADGKLAYVAVSNSNYVSVINTATNTVATTIPVGSYPWDVVLSPDGSKLYVSNSGDGTVSVINTTTNSITGTIHVGSQPYGLSVTNDGARLVVSNVQSNNVSIINTADNSVIATVPVGFVPIASGSFIKNGTNCDGVPLTFDITVNPSTPGIFATAASGNISGCAGSPSTSTQQITVSGNSLSGNVTATAPSGFQVSLSPNSGFANAISITPVSGAVNNTIVYVNAAASGTPGAITGSITLSSPGVSNVSVAVKANINPLPVINPVTSHTYNNKDVTTVIEFSGTASSYSWTNDNTSIGLGPSGTGNIPSFIALNTSASPVVANVSVTPLSPTYAYITNANGNTVTVVNAQTGAKVTTITVQNEPAAVAISADGSRVYVANINSQSISVIDAASNKVLTNIPTGGIDPSRITLSPDGNVLYVANYNSGNVTIINTITNTVTTTLKLGQAPQGIQVSPDGTKFYVADVINKCVYVVSASNYGILATIPVNGTGNNDLTITPDGSKLYVVHDGSNNVDVISLATNTVVATVTVGDNPQAAAASPDGKYVYVANYGSNFISAINTATNVVDHTLTESFPYGAVGITISPDGSRMFVCNAFNNAVDVFDPLNNTGITTIYDGFNAPSSAGNFIAPGTGCTGNPANFTITVNPSAPAINVGTVSGNISACSGSPSVSTEQFNVSANGLTGNITVSATTGFQVSLTQNSDFTNSLSITPVSGGIANQIVYVRATAFANGGAFTGNVILSATGVASKTVTVSATINQLPTVDPVLNQIYNNGDATSTINFTGTANTFTWTNDTPTIGLAASGAGNISSFTATNTGALPVTATVMVTPHSVGYAYVANSQSNNVSVINTLTNIVVNTIPVDRGPFTVAVSPDDSKVYVANDISETISVISTATNTVVATIPFSVVISGMVISPDGSRLYVSNDGDGKIYIVDTSTNTVSGTITGNYVGFGMALSPDGKTLYVADQSTRYVSVFNTTSNSLITDIPVGTNPYDVVMSPDGGTLYSINDLSGDVSVINTATNTVSATIVVGPNPYGAVLSPDGKLLYVAVQSSGQVAVINTANNSLITSINTGGNPTGMSLNGDGSLLYVTDHNNGVIVINTATNTVVTTVGVGQTPLSMGNFITKGTGCTGDPVSFTIKVNPPQPEIITSAATGTITACVGNASISPALEQLTVSGELLTAPIKVTAPAYFEVSTDPNSGFSGSITLPEVNGKVGSTIIYVRSSAFAPTGVIAGNVLLNSAGLADQNIEVFGVINNPPTVNKPADLTYAAGATTKPVSFSGTGNTFTWTNNTPGIGLDDNGVGDVPSFTAINKTYNPITATITVTPVDAPEAYLADDNGNMMVVNLQTQKLIQKFALGAGSNFGSEAITADGSTVYIGDASPGIEVINTANNSLTKTIPVDKVPRALVLSRDDTRAYALTNPGVIDVVYLSAGIIIKRININDNTAQSLALSPDASVIYVGCAGPNIYAINTATGVLQATYIAKSNSVIRGMCVSPDGNTLYAIDGQNTVRAFNTSDGQLIANIPVGIVSTYGYITPDGNKLYITNTDESTVSVINTRLNTVITKIPVGRGPEDIDGIGNSVYVINSLDGTMSVIDINTDMVSSTVTINSPVAFGGKFIKPGSTCPGGSVTFTITVNGATPPDITASGNLLPLTTVYGTASTSESFTVSATGLLSAITVTPPAGFEVSSDGTNFGPTATIGSNTTTVTAVPVYIRLASTTNAGSYKGNITLTSGPTTSNENMPTSKVTPVTLIVTADNKTRPFHADNPPLTVTYSGFVNNDDAKSITTPPLLTTTATFNSAVGQYPITASDAMAMNYTFQYVAGTLTILPAGVLIPNTFTPNGDGINDTWSLIYIDYYPHCTVDIFNRWGQKVFTSIGYGVAWDGRYKGVDLPAGTYYYIINLKNNEPVLSGWVAIIR